jgi:2-polyprenyl-6-hydroxyphenyl methylase / 3-demethylubiquinone-9 3-methyltransferase
MPRADRPSPKISQEVYDRMDNAVYSALGGEWWRPDSLFYQLKVFLNPVRVAYARRTLVEEAGMEPRAVAALDVGCGGGFLTEEIARMGFVTTGVDPSAPSLEAAAAHARESGLDIRYAPGRGEALPFEDGSFGAVFCCDVLEHVRDLGKVVSEISRVLKPGGVFCYDTINRTWLSHLAVIKISQDWKPWAFLPRDLHVWRMFVKPGELRSLLERNGLEWKEHRGLVPDHSIPRLLGYLRKRAKGEWTYAELAARIRMVESRFTTAMYMGWAKKGENRG